MESLRQNRENNLILIAQVHHVGVQDALTLQRISHRLHQLDEAACNWGLSERQEKRTARLEAQSQEIAQKYGFNAYHQGDPRGWSLYLVRPTETDYSQGLGICPH